MPSKKKMDADTAEIAEEPKVDSMAKPKSRRKPKLEPEMTPRKPRKPQPQDIKLSARQYVRVRKVRWERAAGFLLRMKLDHGNNAKKTRPEWESLWEAFWAKPVK